MTTQEHPPSPDDLRLARIKKAVASYDYIPMLALILTNDATDADITDTRLVQARLKHEHEQRDYCLAQAVDHASQGRIRRAYEFYLFTQLHEQTIATVTAYLTAIGADTEDFMAGQRSMFEGVAA